jgi:hypothetical protein
VTGNFISLVYQDLGKRSQSQQAAPVPPLHARQAGRCGSGATAAT